MTKYCPSGCQSLPALRPGGINERAQLFSRIAVPEPGFVLSQLHGDRKEAFVIAIGVQLQQGFEVFNACHVSTSRAQRA